MKQRASESLLNKVKGACERDATIVCARNKLQEANGYSEQYFEYLGLSRDDLKKLESSGLAMRGYARGTTKNGGHALRWVLVTDAEPEEQAEQPQEVNQGVDTNVGQG